MCLAWKDTPLGITMPANIHQCCSATMLLIVLKHAECINERALMTAATYDAPVEQSGGDDQELEALEDGTDGVDTVDPTAEAVKHRTFLECSLC